MSRTIYVFQNVDDAFLRLSVHSQNFVYPSRVDLETKEDIINKSIMQNIFRALRLQNARPSIVYQNWATENFDMLHNSVSNCHNQNSYNHAIEQLTNSLLQYWVDTTDQKLVYGPASKIVNLLVKTIQESNQYRINHIIPFQHVPWDSYTLALAGVPRSPGRCCVLSPTTVAQATSATTT
jgi:hypothetical protein